MISQNCQQARMKKDQPYYQIGFAKFDPKLINKKTLKKGFKDILNLSHWEFIPPRNNDNQAQWRQIYQQLFSESSLFLLSAMVESKAQSIKFCQFQVPLSLNILQKTHFSRLTQLSINSCTITYIQALFQLDTPHLVRLDLSSNNITQLKAFSKYSNSNLKKLSISGNYINEINPLFRANISSIFEQISLQISKLNIAQIQSRSTYRMITLDLSILTKLRTEIINRLQLYTLLEKTKIHKKSFNMIKKKYEKCDLYSRSYRDQAYQIYHRTTQKLFIGSILLM